MKQMIAPLLVGVVVGFFVTVFGLGFMSPSTAEKMAADAKDAAYLETLVPVCVANAKMAGNEEKLAEVKAAQSYSRRGIVEKTDWPVYPAKASVTLKRSIAQACADEIGKMG